MPLAVTLIPGNLIVCLCLKGRALLHWACDRGHKELVSLLLQHKADINSQVSCMFVFVSLSFFSLKVSI